ncbi:MAG: TolC family protein [Bacteroidales bacterium]|nr:TolC family protein [Bacteroidales bacterium]
MNRVIKNILSVFVLSIAMVNAFGQEVMTLEACRKMAIEYNKELKNASYKKQEAIAQQKVARTAFLPAIKADATFMMSAMDDINIPGGFLPTASSAESAQRGEFTGLSNVYSPGMSLEFDNLNIISGGLSVTQPIYAGGKIANLNKQANLGVEISNLGYNLKYSEIIELTDKAYWKLVMIKSNIELAEKYIEMLTEVETQITEMYNLGLKPASEKLRVRVQKNEAELQLLRVQNGLKVAQMYLNRIIGRDLNAPVNVVNNELNVNLIHFEDAVETALSERNELKIRQRQIELSKYEKKIIMADYLPQLGISAKYSNLYVNDIIENNDFKFMLGAQIKIPLFQWGQGYQKKKIANLKIKQAQTELTNTADMVSLEVLQVKTKINEASETIKIAKQNITEVEESLAETKASFEVGLNSITDLLNSQADWQKAQSQLISAVAHYKVLQTIWERVTGRLNPKGL